MFRKNFGQTAAMDAGIHVAKKEFSVTMDGDRMIHRYICGIGLFGIE